MKPTSLGPVFAGPHRIPVPDGLTQARARPFFARAHGRHLGVQDAGAVTEIELYDEIGFWGVTAKDFRALLPKDGGEVLLRINSPGGDVFDGIAMYNDLAGHRGRVRVEVTGLAASAASIVAMAADELAIASNGFLMIHNAWTIAIGEKADFRQTADLLEQVDGALADTYVARSGLERDAVVAMMDAETWLQGQAAVEQGLADRVTGEAQASAAFDLSGFRNTPATLLKALEGLKPGEPTKRDLEMALTQDAGLPRSKARALLRRGLADDVTQDADGEADFVAALRQLQSSIKENLSCV